MIRTDPAKTKARRGKRKERRKEIGSDTRMKPKARVANKVERAYWNRLTKLWCIIRYLPMRDGERRTCSGRSTIHHCGTGAGGRKNHKEVLPLCEHHHLGEEGVDSLNGAMSRREWEEKFGTEVQLRQILGELVSPLTD